MSRFSVRKSLPAVIKPPEHVTTATVATSGTTIKLTYFDSVFVRFPPMTTMLVFEHLTHEATESIKRAVSQALVHYFPFAGRISSGADSEGFSIRCTGEGVAFVTASVDCSLEESKIFDNPSDAKALLDQLVVYYPIGSYGSDDPLLFVQVTEFSCGGLVIGTTWNHAVADGAGIAQLLTAVSEFARGSPSPSVVPVRRDDAVFGLPPLVDPVLEAILLCPHSQDMERVVPLDVTVPWALINRIKAESRGHFDDGKPCTVFEAVLAVLWRCRVRATMSSISSNPGRTTTPVCLTFAANIRRHVGAKVGYYGNCITNQLVVAGTSSAVASAGIVDLVKMIRRAKDQMHDKLRVAREEDEGRDDCRQAMRGLSGLYDMLHVSSWRNIGFEQVNFGSGAPARVMFHGPGGGAPLVPVCTVYPPCKGKDGVNVFSNLVKREHADAFLREIAEYAHA